MIEAARILKRVRRMIQAARILKRVRQMVQGARILKMTLTGKIFLEVSHDFILNKAE
jgi:hypothetical protein